jgi:hypothetical protein
MEIFIPDFERTNMKAWIFLLMLLFPLSVGAQVLRIGPGGYASLQVAAVDARPGDTLLFMAGTHTGGSYISNLQGRADAWIVITGPASGEARITGGSTALQFSDPAFLKIRGLVFEGQTGNGVNIDDAGSMDTPAHDIIIEQCTFRDINATGNNDLLKMSGVDDFVVRDCVFLNGSPGGSMIDMVGCHNGVFENNVFTNGGSNSIQAKGGTSDILITRNRFINGGQRAINIGGSTGLAFFRPSDANFEAARIFVYANLFRGGMTPFAYVGAVHCDVANNTVLYPDKWVMRILQETTDARFLQCGDNSFRNNLVVVDNRAISPSVNIGGNTRPETFTFANNLWYNSEQGLWAGPSLPSTETNGRYGMNPMLRNIAANDVAPLAASPAIGAGLSIPGLRFDLPGQRYNAPPSIGAIEGNPATTIVQAMLPARETGMQIYPHPVGGDASIRVTAAGENEDVALLYDMLGKKIAGIPLRHSGAGVLSGRLEAAALPKGMYLLVLASQPQRRSIISVVR